MEGQVLREEGIDGPRETVGEPQPGTGGSVPPIILCQSLPKGQKMDLIVRQATEAGIERILPFVSEHSVPTVGKDAEGIRKMGTVGPESSKEAANKAGPPWRTVVEKPTDQPTGSSNFGNPFPFPTQRLWASFFIKTPLRREPYTAIFAIVPKL